MPPDPLLRAYVREALQATDALFAASHDGQHPTGQEMTERILHNQIVLLKCVLLLARERDDS